MSAGSAPFGFKRHRTGARASFHAAPQIIEDRSPDSGHGAPSLGSDGHQLCPPTLVRNRLPTTTLLTSEPDQLGPAVHKTGKQTSSQRELCQKFVPAPPRKALAVVSSRAPLPSSPIAPADYHFRYLLLIGEKERLNGLPFRSPSRNPRLRSPSCLSPLSLPSTSHLLLAPN